MNRAVKFGVPLVVFCVAGMLGLQLVRYYAAIAAAIACLGGITAQPSLSAQFVGQKYERMDKQVKTMSERRFELQEEHKVSPG